MDPPRTAPTAPSVPALDDPGVDGSPGAMRAMSEGLVDALAELHGLDPVAAGLGALGRPAGFVARQVRGWTRRYLDARSESVPAIESAAQWLEEQLPLDAGAA